ncbi:MAG: ABC transporter permease [Nocardioides sp.]
MSTATIERPPESSAPVPSGQRSPARPPRSLPRWVGVLGVFAVWFVVWLFARGTDTLELAGREHTALHESLTQFRDSIIANRDTNPVMQVTTATADLFRSAVDWLQRMVSMPNLPRPVPEIGWLGVTAVATWIGLLIANWRISLLIAATLTSCGLLGYWTDAIDLLLVTLLAVSIVVIIGMPLAILVGNSRRANAMISWVLDLMQTMPTFVYLIPVVLFFGIGVSGAVVSTLIYALPPMIRIAGHGIRTVSSETIEATDSTGQNGWQRLAKVQLPLARATIIVGLNQSIMAALSMATIASYIDGPGLGKPVLNGLIKGDVGAAVVPGLLIVALAVMLDRTTTAASERAEIAARGRGHDPRTRRIILGVGGAVAVLLIWVSRYFPWAAEFPDNPVGTWLADVADSSVTWVTDTFGVAATAVKDLVTTAVLNPLQALLA